MTEDGKIIIKGAKVNNLKDITVEIPRNKLVQKVNVKNPRSTVATTTEIYDYLRIIFARIGRTYSPISGKEVKCHSVNDVMASILSGDSRTAYILADLNWSAREDKVELMLRLKEEGYSRFFGDDGIIRIEDIMRMADKGEYPEHLDLLIDRLKLPVFKECLPYSEDGSPWPQNDWERADSSSARTIPRRNIPTASNWTE